MRKIVWEMLTKGQPMFDEQPDGDIHGECAEEIKRLGISLKIKTEEHDCCAEDLMTLMKERKHLRYLLTMAYAKLYGMGISYRDPALTSAIEKYLQNTGD